MPVTSASCITLKGSDIILLVSRLKPPIHFPSWCHRQRGWRHQRHVTSDITSVPWNSLFVSLSPPCEIPHERGDFLRYPKAIEPCGHTTLSGMVHITTMANHPIVAFHALAIILLELIVSHIPQLTSNAISVIFNAYFGGERRKSQAKRTRRATNKIALRH